MIKRTLYFGNAAQLRLKHQQLSIERWVDEKAQTDLVPVEDIGVLVLDHPQITISSGLLQALQHNNTVLISCDERHMPQALLFPLEGHSTQQERYDEQLKASEPLKKQLWAQTVTQKIKNQARVLDHFLLDASYLIPLYKNVKSGDSDNCEATAAAHYWSKLFAHVPGFKRLPGQTTPPNHWLNYGYAVLRATMARSIVAAGLLPTLGIFHRNRYNAFCLADDLMEPYRPYVDQMVFNMVRQFGLPEGMEKEHKAELLKLPAIDVTLEGETSPLMLATQRTAVSLNRCFEGTQRKLLYPEL